LKNKILNVFDGNSRTDQLTFKFFLVTTETAKQVSVVKMEIVYPVDAQTIMTAIREKLVLQTENARKIISASE
jgi:hypothetical protein